MVQHPARRLNTFISGCRPRSVMLTEDHLQKILAQHAARVAENRDSGIYAMVRAMLDRGVPPERIALVEQTKGLETRWWVEERENPRVRAAVLEEREACAKVCDGRGTHAHPATIAAAIRRRPAP